MPRIAVAHIAYVRRGLRRRFSPVSSPFRRCAPRGAVGLGRTWRSGAQVLSFSVLKNEVVDGGVAHGVPWRTVS